MTLYSILSSNIKVEYKSPLFSIATLITLTASFLTFTLPFILAYRSKGLWIKNYEFYEQPIVQFNYEYLIVAEINDPSNPITCGESPFMQNINDDENCSLFSFQEFDDNLDGKYDSFEFDITLNIPSEQSVTSLLIILNFNLQLESTCPLQMQTIAVIDKAFAVPTSQFTYLADFIVHQNAPLQCIKNNVNVHNNQSLLHHDIKNEFNIREIIRNNFKRDFSTILVNDYHITRPGRISTFDVNIKIHVPELKIRYQPNIWQELVSALPLYLSLYIIFYRIFEKIRVYVLNNRLVMAWKILPCEVHNIK